MITNVKKPVTVEALPGMRKAAILLVILGDQSSAEIIRQLSEDEVQLVSREVARINSISAEQAEWVLEEFNQMLRRSAEMTRVCFLKMTQGRMETDSSGIFLTVRFGR